MMKGNEKNLDMGDSEIPNIFIDLDSLFDTRLALLYLLNEDLTEEIVQNGKYHKRTMDEFGNISGKVFKALYKKRGKGLLNYALPTRVFELINFITAKYVTDKTNLIVPKVIVNTHPYILTEEEKNKFVGVLQPMIACGEVEMVTMNPYTEVTPKWIDSNINSIVMYEGIEWIEMHNRLLNLSYSPLPFKTLVVPALMEDKPNDPSIKLDSMLFKAIAKTLEPHISTEFADANYFSAVIKN